MRFIIIAGEFTQENQQRIKHEEEKEQAKIDPWKVCRPENICGAVFATLVKFSGLLSLGS